MKNDHQENTRQELINVAISLMAENGIHAVSLRSVNEAAKSLNSSAAHYYFGGKLGLIEAAYGHIMDWVMPRQSKMFDELEKRIEEGEIITLRQILEAIYIPYFSLLLQPGYGPSACKFMARLLMEADPNIQEILNSKILPTTMRSAVFFSNVLQKIPPHILITRMLITVTTALYGAADVRVLWNSPFGDMSPEQPIDLFERLFEYLEGALTAPWGDTDPGLAERIEAMYKFDAKS